jgi:hypothetical protein
MFPSSATNTFVAEHKKKTRGVEIEESRLTVGKKVRGQFEGWGRNGKREFATYLMGMYIL